LRLIQHLKLCGWCICSFTTATLSLLGRMTCSPMRYVIKNKVLNLPTLNKTAQTESLRLV
jgi:hypothetical protein